MENITYREPQRLASEPFEIDAPNIEKLFVMASRACGMRVYKGDVVREGLAISVATSAPAADFRYSKTDVERRIREFLNAKYRKSQYRTDIGVISFLAHTRNIEGVTEICGMSISGLRRTDAEDLAKTLKDYRIPERNVFNRIADGLGLRMPVL